MQQNCSQKRSPDGFPECSLWTHRAVHQPLICKYIVTASAPQTEAFWMLVHVGAEPTASSSPFHTPAGISELAAWLQQAVKANTSRQQETTGTCVSSVHKLPTYPRTHSDQCQLPDSTWRLEWLAQLLASHGTLWRTPCTKDTCDRGQAA